MPTDRTCTLVTVCLDDAAALEQALPLILSFAAVGIPPSVFFEYSPSKHSMSSTQISKHLEQLLEFGVSEVFASDSAKSYLDQHCSSFKSVTNDAARVRALHTQAHAIYAF